MKKKGGKSNQVESFSLKWWRYLMKEEE